MSLSKKIEDRLSMAALILVGILSTFSFIQASAQEAPEQPFWGVPQLPQLSVEDEAYTIPQHAGEHCSYEKFFVSVMDRSIPVPSPREDCSMSTVYGELTKDNFLRFKNDTAYHHINNNNRLPVLVPNKDAYFYQSGIGNGNRGLFAYDGLVSTFEINPGVQSGFQGVRYEKEFFVREGKVSRALQRTTDGLPVVVGSADASSNGNWIIANLGAGRLARVNPDTFEMMVFPGSFPRFSSSSRAQPDMMITNDGRYVAMSGGFSGSFVFKLFDLSTCTVPNPADNMSIAENCEQRDITEFMKQQIPGFFMAEHLRFSSDGTQLYMTARTEGGGVQRVTLTAPGQTPSKLEYLALGDSYSSGEGDTERDPANGNKYYIAGTDVEAEESNQFITEKCHISSRSYPFLLAERMSIGEDFFKSVTCSGAVIDDVYAQNVNYLGQGGRLENLGEAVLAYQAQALNDYLPGRIRQMDFVVDSQPDALTVSISGNDVGFEDFISSAAKTPLSTSVYADTDVGKNLVGTEIQNQYERLKQLFTEFQRASPKTKIYVLGYPQFIDYPASNCGLNVQLDEKERQMVHEGVKYLNDVIEAAARSSGVRYINIENSMQGKALCGDADVPHVTGVAGFAPWSDDEQQESFHPNHLGHYDMHLAIEDALAPANLLTYENCEGMSSGSCPDNSVSAPPMPDYFAPNTINRAIKRTPFINDESVEPAQNIPIKLDGLQPHSTARVERHSEPVELGNFTVSANGELDAMVTMPIDTAPGYHTLHVYAKTPSGEEVDFYQIFFVIASEEDTDGNGIPDDEQQCTFIQPANVDQDRDGIDDACDPFIDKPKLPGAPTVVITDKINAAAQSNVEISGTAEENTTAVITVDDQDDATEPVRYEAIAQAAADGGFSYSAQLDVSSLADGGITVSVVLKNEHGEGEPSSAVSSKDTVAPSVQAALNPLANGNGWYDGDVTVGVSASDENGVARVTYEMSGAQAAEMTSVAGESASVVVSSEGETSFSYAAVDGFGNPSEPAIMQVRIDASNPNVSIQSDRNPAYIQLLGRHIRGTSSDSLSDVREIKVSFTNVKNKRVTTLAATCELACASWHVSPYALPIGQYTVRAVAYDSAGNMASTSMDGKITVVSLPAWLSRLF